VTDTSTLAAAAPGAAGTALAGAAAPPRGAGPAVAVREALLLAGRSLRTIPRVPERLIDVTLQPAIFIVLFLYVLGSAVRVPGMSYTDFLLPGVIAQQIAFSVIGAGTATAVDMGEGVVDRFRSLPIARIAVVTGQVIGQFCEALLGVLVVAVFGLILGWRPDMAAGDVVVAVALVLVTLFAFMWAGVVLGLAFRSADAAQGFGFTVMLPLTFMAGTFVPIAGMDLVPRTIAEWNPISPLVAAMRELTGGVHAPGGSWPLEHPIAGAFGWAAILLAVFVPLALVRFRRATQD
jgi:ABC-2 type transport system permease protein